MKNGCIGALTMFSCFVIACLTLTGINKLNNLDVQFQGEHSERGALLLG